MRSSRLGCLTGAGVLTAIITALVIAGYAVASGGLMFSPGPLSTHTAEEILGGVKSHAEIGGDCDACHTAPWESAVMADRCVECHGEIAVQMQDVASMHGALLHNNPQLGCRHRHPEHRGANAALTELGDAEFPHEAVGFSLNAHRLTAAQVPFTCSDCHTDDISSFELQTCESCHRQMDVGFMTAHTLSFGRACLDCHDGVDRFGAHFDHNNFPFQIRGLHIGLTCDQCHFEARGLSDFPTTPQDCVSCHQNDEPHEGRFGFRCADCHTEQGWTPADFDHDLASFRLEGEHAEVACESCHTNGQFKGTPGDCYACHKEDDEHEGRFGTDCSACHTPFDWDDADFDHNRSAFPLTGGHEGAACEQCHSNGQFAGLSTDCASCHGDPAYHTGLFGLDCAACHTVNNWFAEYHGSHPDIADEGGRGVNHGGASCRDCHTQTLHSATCLACHESNNPDDDSGHGGDDDDDD